MRAVGRKFPLRVEGRLQPAQQPVDRAGDRPQLPRQHAGWNRRHVATILFLDGLAQVVDRRQRPAYDQPDQKNADRDQHQNRQEQRHAAFRHGLRAVFHRICHLHEGHAIGGACGVEVKIVIFPETAFQRHVERFHRRVVRADENLAARIAHLIDQIFLSEIIGFALKMTGRLRPLAPRKVVEDQRHQPLSRFLQRTVEEFVEFVFHDRNAEDGGNQPESGGDAGQPQDQPAGHAARAGFLLRHAGAPIL